MDFDALDMAKERHTSQIYIIQSEQSKNRAIIIYNRRRETNRTHRKLDQCYFKLVCVVDKYVPFQSNYTRWSKLHKHKHNDRYDADALQIIRYELQLKHTQSKTKEFTVRVFCISIDNCCTLDDDRSNDDWMANSLISYIFGSFARFPLMSEWYNY